MKPVAKTRRKTRFETMVTIVLPICAAVSFVLFFLYFTYSAFCTVSGRELNVSTWQIRRFSFGADPFTQWQVFATKHSNDRSIDPTITKHLAGGPAQPSLARWDLISITRSVSTREAEAAVLMNYLGTLDSKGDNFWTQWTVSNPNDAPVFWGAVRDLCHLHRYQDLPRLFELPDTNSETPLQNRIQDTMLEVLRSAAASEQSHGSSDQALLNAQVGLTYGDSEDLQRIVENASTANDKQ